MIVKTIRLYRKRRDVTLTAYILADSPELLNGKKRPAILICPGGAYINCSDREAEPVALRFAAMGYHAFVPRYSIYSKGVPSFFPVGCKFFKKQPPPFKPAAVILGYGISDYHLMFGEINDPFARDLSDAASIAYMGTKSPAKELLDTISPALHVTKNTPPTFLWATAADALVPVENTIRMANALAKAGIPFEAHIFEDGPHGLSLADQSTAGSLLELDADAAKWIDLAEAWLRKRFALPLPAKPAWLAAAEADQDGGK